MQKMHLAQLSSFFVVCLTTTITHSIKAASYERTSGTLSGARYGLYIALSIKLYDAITDAVATYQMSRTITQGEEACNTILVHCHNSLKNAQKELAQEEQRNESIRQKLNPFMPSVLGNISMSYLQEATNALRKKVTKEKLKKLYVTAKFIRPVMQNIQNAEKPRLASKLRADHKGHKVITYLTAAIAACTVIEGISASS